MLKLSEYILEMSRPRKKALSFVLSVQDTVQEHIFKIYAYGASNPEDITGWYISLSKHVKKFRIMNVGVKKPNIDKETMFRYFVDELFEPNDVKQLANIYFEDYGDGILTDNSKDTLALREIAVRYIDFMLDKDSKTYRVNNSKVFS